MRMSLHLATGAGLDVAVLPQAALDVLERAAGGEPIDPLQLDRVLAAAEHVGQTAAFAWLNRS
jgi:hypothetical protein